MPEIKYCRREIGDAPRLCGDKIARSNALHWCDRCRERLPLWPVLIESYEKHIVAAVRATIEDRPASKEVSTTDGDAMLLDFGAPLALEV